MRREGIMERSRGFCGASVVAKALRRLHEAFVEPPWLLAAPPWSLRGAFVEPSWRFGATLAPPVIRQIMTGPGSKTMLPIFWELSFSRSRVKLGLSFYSAVKTLHSHEEGPNRTV